MSNKFYTEELYIVHDEFLRNGEKLDVDDFYIDYFIRTAKGSENDAVIVSKDDYQKLPSNRQYLISIIQTASGPYFQNSITIYTCIKDLRPPNTVCTYANICYSKNLPRQVKARL